jgi:hypothetical protein
MELFMKKAIILLLLGTLLSAPVYEMKADPDKDKKTPWLLRFIFKKGTKYNPGEPASPTQKRSGCFPFFCKKEIDEPREYSRPSFSSDSSDIWSQDTDELSSKINIQANRDNFGNESRESGTSNSDLDTSDSDLSSC